MREAQSSLAQVAGRLACAVAAAFALGAAHAATVTVVETAKMVPIETVIVTGNVNGKMTRSDVKQAYRSAKLTNRLTPTGEIGDTREVLKARDEFNKLQREVLAQQRIIVPERVSVLTDEERHALESRLDDSALMAVLIMEDEH